MDFDKVLALIDAMNREGVEYITFGAVALYLWRSEAGRAGPSRAPVTRAAEEPRPRVSAS